MNNTKKRMVGLTDYEIKQTVLIGNKEIIFAEDTQADDGMQYFVGNYSENYPFGYYEECMTSDDFLEIMQEFINRANRFLACC